MLKKLFQKKIKNFYQVAIIFLILFQNIAPLFLIVSPVSAVVNKKADKALISNVSLEFGSQNNEIILRGFSDKVIDYSLIYQSDDLDFPKKAAVGIINIDNESSLDQSKINFEETIYIGTCSGSVCIPDDIDHGVLVLNEGQFEASFILKDGVLWLTHDDIWTVAKVKKGITYTTPQNDQLNLRFTSLPNNSGSVSIEEIILTKDQSKAFGTTSNVAYDITSSMENGSFTYDLTLPAFIEDSGSSESTQIIFTENLSDLDNIILDNFTKVDTITEDGKAKVENLNHFTIFIVTNNAVTDCPSGVYAAGVCYSTIQSAVNAADPSDADGIDTINISVGTYVESVFIDRAVNISCQSGAILDGAGLSTDNSPQAAFNIASSGVTIDGCEIINYRRGITATSNTAYQNIIISNNNIHDLAPHSYFNSGAGDYTSVAISFGKSTDTMLVNSDQADGGFSTISSEIDLGLRLNYSGLLIHDNTISGTNNTYSGINLSAIDGAVVRDNSIQNMRSSGIAVDSASNIIINNNIINNNVLSGIFISDSEDNDGGYGGGYDMWEVGNGGLGPNNISILSNTITNNGHASPAVWGTWARLGNNGISVLSNPAQITATNNTITGNDSYSNGSTNINGGNGIANFLPNISDGQVNALYNDWDIAIGDNLPRDLWSGDGSFYDTNTPASGDYAYGNILYAVAVVEAEYQLDSCSGNIATDSVGSYTATISGNVNWTEGRNQQSLDFNGIDNYIDVIGTGGGIDLGTIHTISTWVNVNDFSDPSQNVVFGEASNRYALWFQDSDSIYYRAGTDWARFDLTSALNTNEWYQIVFVRNNTSVELYINGISQGIDTFTDNDSLIINYIGKENNGGGTQYFYNGRLDEIRLYRGVLSSADVMGMYADYGVLNPVACSDGSSDGGSGDSGGGSGGSSGGGGSASAPVCSSQAPFSAPSLTAINTSANTVLLTWSAVSPVTHYALTFYRNSDGAVYGSTNIGNTTSYTVSHLDIGESYSFQVFGVNECAPGDRSNIATTLITTGINISSTDRPIGQDGAVLGTHVYLDDEATSEAQINVEKTGEIAGVISCSSINNFLPWVILLAQLIALLIVEIIMRKKDSKGRLLLILISTLFSIVLFYLLRRCDCYEVKSILSWLCKYYWVVAILLTFINRIFSYFFIEEEA